MRYVLRIPHKRKRRDESGQRENIHKKISSQKMSGCREQTHNGPTDSGSYLQDMKRLQLRLS